MAWWDEVLQHIGLWLLLNHRFVVLQIGSNNENFTMVINSHGPAAMDSGVFAPESLGYVVDEPPLGEPRKLRIITIGAGASGLNVVRQIEQHMQNVDLQIYEKNADVGGTWLENKYATTQRA